MPKQNAVHMQYDIIQPMLIHLFVVNISQCIPRLGCQVTHLKCMHFLVVNYALIKLRERERKGMNLENITSSTMSQTQNDKSCCIIPQMWGI